MVVNSIEIQELVKQGLLPEVTDENYYSQEINENYMSFHTWLSLHGSDGLIRCQARAIAEQKGEWTDDEADNKSLMIGAYVDSILAGDENEHEKFLKENPSVFTYEKSVDVERAINEHPDWVGRNGSLKSALSLKKVEETDPTLIKYTPKGLKSEYQMANKMIERCQRDKKFMWYLSGEKQKIFTTILFGIPVKCKLDSYMPCGEPIITDLKTTKDIHKLCFKPDVGHIDFISYYGYVYQLAFYREIVYRVTGKMCECFVNAVSKSPKHPEIKVVEIDGFSLDSAISEIENSIKNTDLVRVWRYQDDPVRCERPSCPYCVDTEVLTKVIPYQDLILTY